MDIQKEIKIAGYQPFALPEAGGQLLFSAVTELYHLDRPGSAMFAASMFYNLGRVQGIREERARRKQRGDRRG
ncbi:hypothetical protein [Cuneatibacter caecimuris]|uniref:Uncharacterized protein n=1 Tax=Cuneatibacter caecimuris TaxID=1796618 RepID=A0A4Q7PP99_9FIRM|nr:hypothetical protein [Cuneatibacter caecimuris]RZT02106.1 hypothetical protein EV209_0211 [Cuneatibacter caecimuris]